LLRVGFEPPPTAPQLKWLL